MTILSKIFWGAWPFWLPWLRLWLLSTCASLYCSHAKQIREYLDELEQQAKVTLSTGNRRTLPQRDKGKQQENDKSVFGSDALD